MSRQKSGEPRLFFILTIFGVILYNFHTFSKKFKDIQKKWMKKF